ncbi:NAD-dependent epimerase/dehydratase family protein [Nonomuraea sp. NPDC048826]|uniref:NAD-dependent epimerase/dehydratase family protein n=1 Tax=Nonomuraea sp. NPDC048826 TaxID=3364347 RepID=UPI00371B18D4
MEIVGRGFLASAFAVLSDRHPRVTLVAAGPSSTGIADRGVFAREETMLRDVLADCRRRDRTVVVFSSASHAVYGNTARPAAEADPCSQASPFGRHKLGIESMVGASGVCWLIVRLSHAVGAGQRDHQLFPSMVRAVRAGKVRLYRDCHRDLLDVTDAVRAVDALLTAGVEKETVNVATGAPYPVEAIVDHLERRLAVRATREVVDTPPSRTLVSTAKLHRLTPGLEWPTADEAYLDRLVRVYAHLY